MATKETVERLLQRYPLPEDHVYFANSYLEKEEYDRAITSIVSSVEIIKFNEYIQAHWAEEYRDLKKRSYGSDWMKYEGYTEDEEGLVDYKDTVYREDDPRMFQSKEQIDRYEEIQHLAWKYIHNLEEEYKNTRWPEEYPELKKRCYASGEIAFDEATMNELGYVEYEFTVYRKDDPEIFQSKEQIDRLNEIEDIARNDCYGIEIQPKV